MDKVQSQAPDAIVSFDSEQLILVDEADREIGFKSKAECHVGRGTLHRAFSLVIFNSAGELLLQQRSAGKRLWPLYWSNTCCSHPRRGETMEVAIRRRLHEELRLVAPLKFLFKFHYQAQFEVDGAEHELCWVYAGRSDTQAQVNPNEIAAVRYLSVPQLEAEMAEHPEHFTPWFHLEWARIRELHLEELQGLSA